MSFPSQGSALLPNTFLPPRSGHGFGPLSIEAMVSNSFGQCEFQLSDVNVFMELLMIPKVPM